MATLTLVSEVNRQYYNKKCTCIGERDNCCESIYMYTYISHINQKTLLLSEINKFELTFTSDHFKIQYQLENQWPLRNKSSNVYALKSYIYQTHYRDYIVVLYNIVFQEVLPCSNLVNDYREHFIMMCFRTL